MASQLLSLLLLLFLLAAAAAGSHLDDASTLGWIGGGGGGMGMGMGIGIGMDMEEEEEVEFDLGSESSRRILAARRYISYNALRRDSVPCSQRGASYYNCRPGAQANPYSHGCNAITHCRG